MITVHIQYFAILREQRGVARETLSTSATTTAALYDECARATVSHCRGTA